MDEFAKTAGYGSLGVILGGICGYLVRLLLEQRLRRELETHKHTLTTLANRLDFLHQERGKAALDLVRLVKSAKMHIKLLIDPMQLGPVDRKQAAKDANIACTNLHNFIADSSFLFPKRIEAQMLEIRTTLWSILDEAVLQFPPDYPLEQRPDRTLWKTLRKELDPLEEAIIAEVRLMLGASADD